MDIEKFFDIHKVSCAKLIHTYRELIPPQGICFDVGSNAGMFTAALLDRFPELKIHAFEPVKEYYEFSLKKLPQTNVVINNIGLSNKEEDKIIHIDTTNNPGWNTYIKERTQNNMNCVETQLTTLDKYCHDNNINQIDFVKIDTEGYEAYVLEGFLETLRKFTKKPTLLIELGWGTNHPEWTKSKKIFQQLYDMGYKSDINIDTLRNTRDVLFRE